MKTFRRFIMMSEIQRLIDNDAPLILEIGANDGRDSLRFLASFPDIRLWCFEPDSRAIAEFKGKVSDLRCQLVEVAVGNETGRSQFFSSSGTPPRGCAGKDWNRSGSIHQPTGHLVAHPWCRFDKVTTVDIVTLDDWARCLRSTEVIDFVWMDVQGAEADVIRGGSATLGRSRFLYTEFSNLQLYDGQVDFNGLAALLPNWECIGTYRNNALFRNSAMS